MSLRTEFRELLAEAERKQVGPAVRHVSHGPLRLYLRVGRRLVQGAYQVVVQIGSVSINDESQQRRGIFTEALAILMEETPMSIYIECVHNQEFGDAMIRRGFVVVRDTMGFERDLFLAR